jgi:hypothetical protein
MLHLPRTLLAIWLPTSVALLSVACGGSSSDNGGGIGTLGGSTGNTGGAGTVGGNAGTTGAAGSSAVAGSSSSGGATGTGGSANGGSANGGSANGGSANGGNTSSGGSGGGDAGSAGTGGKAACAALMDAANQALANAQTCDPTLNVDPCTGSVRGICGCMLATQPNDSAATKAYLAALMAVQSNKCVQLCPAIACIAPGPGLCVQQAGSSMGMCTNGHIAAQ